MPTLLTVAGKAALRGHVLIPRVGAWHGTLWLDADTAPTGAASLVWGDSEATWSATILRGGVMTEGGPAEVRFVGGGGGLATALAGGSYRNTSPRSLLGQILPGGGERLSGTSPTTTLDAAIARWSRDAGTCGQQIARLADSLGADASKLPHELLSEREFQVFLRLAKGETVGHMADSMSLSVKTVSTYRTRVMEKMKLASNSDLTYYALKNGLIQ